MSDSTQKLKNLSDPLESPKVFEPKEKLENFKDFEKSINKETTIENARIFEEIEALLSSLSSKRKLEGDVKEND